MNEWEFGDGGIAMIFSFLKIVNVLFENRIYVFLGNLLCLMCLNMFLRLIVEGRWGCKAGSG